MTKLEKLKKFLSTHISLITWDYDGYKNTEYSDNSCQKDWNQTLVTKINQISAIIFQDTKKGGANVILIPTGIIEDILMSLEYTRVNRINYDEFYKLGELAGRYYIYVVPELTKTKIEVNNSEYVDVNENKIYVCKLKNNAKFFKENNYFNIFNVNNYIKIGVINILNSKS